MLVVIESTYNFFMIQLSEVEDFCPSSLLALTVEGDSKSCPGPFLTTHPFLTRCSGGHVSGCCGNLPRPQVKSLKYTHFATTCSVETGASSGESLFLLCKLPLSNSNSIANFVWAVNQLRSICNTDQVTQAGVNRVCTC